MLRSGHERLVARPPAGRARPQGTPRTLALSRRTIDCAVSSSAPAATVTFLTSVAALGFLTRQACISFVRRNRSRFPVHTQTAGSIRASRAFSVSKDPGSRVFADGEARIEQLFCTRLLVHRCGGRSVCVSGAHQAWLKVSPKWDRHSCVGDRLKYRIDHTGAGRGFTPGAGRPDMSTLRLLDASIHCRARH